MDLEQNSYFEVDISLAYQLKIKIQENVSLLFSYMLT